MKHRPTLTIAEALERRADEYRRQALAVFYRELANEVRERWPLSSHPNPPAPRLTQRLALLEVASGRTPPKDTLTARDVLRIARQRS